MKFDPGFLAVLGADLLDFEQTVGWSVVGGEQVPIWYDNWYAANGVAGGLPIRLNWAAGFDGDANAGFDPVYGLLAALTDQPEATKQLLTSHVLLDGSTPNGRLPLVDYLVTERIWLPDYAGHYYYENAEQHLYPPDWETDWSRHNLGHAMLGKVLEEAVIIGDGPVDQRSTRIFESIIFELNRDWPHPHRDDMIPVAMRGSVANMVSDYIIDIKPGCRR